MNNIMIAIERLSDSEDAALLSIGAVMFNEKELGNVFYQSIAMKDSYYYGDISINKINWLLSLSKMQQAEYINKNLSLDLKLAIKKLNEFICKNEVCEPIKIWAKTKQDISVLRAAYSRIDMQTAWRFDNEYSASEIIDCELMNYDHRYNTLSKAVCMAKEITKQNKSKKYFYKVINWIKKWN